MFFDAETMWSQNNANTNGDPVWRGDGIYINSADDRLSLGGDFYYDGVNSQLGLEGQLLMDTNSEITNSGNDYSITDNGMELEAPIMSGKSPAHLNPEPNVLNWVRGSSEAASISGYFPDTTIQESEGRLSLSAGGGQGTVELSAQYIDIGSLPTSDPGITGVLWNDNGTVKVSS